MICCIRGVNVKCPDTKIPTAASWILLSLLVLAPHDMLNPGCGDLIYPKMNLKKKKIKYGWFICETLVRISWDCRLNVCVYTVLKPNIIFIYTYIYIGGRLWFRHHTHQPQVNIIVRQLPWDLSLSLSDSSLLTTEDKKPLLTTFSDFFWGTGEATLP